MEVDPSNKDLFCGRLEKRTKLFTVLKKAEDLGAISECDFFHRQLSSNLPADTEYQVRLLLQEGGGIDTNKLYLTLGGCQTEIKVFTNLVDVEVLSLVDDTHVHAVLLHQVQEANKHHAVRHAVEKVSIIHGQAFCDEFIAF